MGREGRQLNKCIFIGSMICVFASNLDKIGHRNSTMWFIYLFILIDWASHHTITRTVATHCPRLPDSGAQEELISAADMASLNLLSPFPSTWLWCSTSLGSNSGLALCLWLENKTLFSFLCCVPYRGWGRRYLLAAKALQSYYRKATVCSSPFSPLLEV